MTHTASCRNIIIEHIAGTVFVVAFFHFCRLKKEELLCRLIEVQQPLIFFFANINFLFLLIANAKKLL